MYLLLGVGPSPLVSRRAGRTTPVVSVRCETQVCTLFRATTQ